MARLRYHQEILIGNQAVNLNRDEIQEERHWNLVKTWSVPVAAAFVLYLAFMVGQCNPNCRSNCQPTATPAVIVPGIDRLASAIEKVADAKPATATASATSAAESTAKTSVTPVAVTVKVAGIDQLASAVEKLAEAKPTPLTVQPPIDPLAGMTPVQRCNYQIVVQRKARC